MVDKRKEDLCKLEGLDQLVEESIKEFKVPGVSLAVVKDGELLFSKGYGYRDPENSLMMDADTLYPIASNSKAFVSMALAMLVDEGKLEWDKPVRHYIPYFRLMDSYASENATPRDLLCHRIGLPAHDGATHDCKSRKEIVEKLQYLEPSRPFRTELQYNNLMFITAGHLVDCITGQTWESFVQERIFNTLEMKRSNFSYCKSRLSGNYAKCFYLENDEPKEFKLGRDVDPEYIYPGSPAGGINSSVNELANWIILQMNKGEFKGRRIVSENAFAEMHSPQMVDNWNSPHEEHGESSCGLGWFIWAYRGEKLVVHSGFFGSDIYMMPKRNIGIALMPTLKASPIPDIVIYNVFDRLLGLNQIDWPTRKRKEIEEEKKKQQEVSVQVKGTSPSHALEAYCGEFSDKGYGKFIVKLREKGLYIEDERRHNSLRHYHYDTFEVLGENNEDVYFKITFHTDAKGIISSISSPFEPEVKDIVFTRTI